VARKKIFCRKSFFTEPYPPFFLFNAVSAEVGVAWECAVANCFYVSHIPPFQM